GPGDVAGEVDGRQVAAVEGGIHQLAVGHRRRGRMGILGLLPAWALAEDLLVPEDLAVVAVQAEDVTGRAVLRGRGKEDSISPDDGRRPAGAGNLGSPGQVVGEAPGEGQVLFGGDALAGRTPEAGPVVGPAGQGAKEDGEG